eukprot:TRINITY_DN65853_c0_g1_i1.p1 TRINITY_DN65853_c0_g1~~TRINITY_DN65853_c0_g1_i1.p1  ORF type:complete len:236 (+),score=52.72 TRINITY_DN65853_c0_g1_i1:95-709(+)
MKGVNSEGSNTEKMQQHQMMKKARGGATSLKHEDVDLMVCTDLIDRVRTCALNASSDNASVLDVLDANPDDRPLTSDIDQQIIVKVFFKEKVNLANVLLRFNKPLEDKEDEELYRKPRLVKLFGNKDDFDFQDIDDAAPAAQAVIEDKDATEVTIPCLGGRFQRLSSLQILIEEVDNPNDESSDVLRSYLNRIRVNGHKNETYD